MSLESVIEFFKVHAPDIIPVIRDESTATVAEAAQTLGVEEGQIAKTLAMKIGEERVLVVMAGTGRLDNRKTRDTFGSRPRMLSPEDVLALTSHPVGGVCPFGLPTSIRVCCDTSLKVWDEVWPAAGSVNSAVKLSPARLAELTGAEWIDIAKTSMD